MSSDYTQQQSPADEQRSKDLSLASTRPPTEVPGYQAQRFLGAGAYGEVWAGVDKNTGRKVAIKFYAHRRGVDRLAAPKDRRVQAVVRGVGLCVDDARARHSERSDDRLDHIGATSLTEVRHTFNDSIHVLPHHT